MYIHCCNALGQWDLDVFSNQLLFTWPIAVFLWTATISEKLNSLSSLHILIIFWGQIVKYMHTLKWCLFQLTNSYRCPVTSHENYTGSTDYGYDVTHGEIFFVKFLSFWFLLSTFLSCVEKFAFLMDSTLVQQCHRTINAKLSIIICVRWCMLRIFIHERKKVMYNI